MRNISAAKQRFGVPVEPDSSAKRIIASSVSHDLIRPEEIGLAVSIHINTSAGVISNLGAFKKCGLTAKVHGDPGSSIRLDDVRLACAPE